MTDMDEDTELAMRAGAGDRMAFGILLERHYDRVYRVALGMLGNGAEAEDVAQDVWAAMPGRLRGWRGEARFTTWLHTVTLNAGRDAMRRSATRARLTAGFMEIDDLRRGEDADTEARLHWLRAALEALSDDLRETAALVLGDDMTHARAAEVLGVAEGTVAWRMSEIRKRLRAMAQGEEAWA
jgi:RNA polymerase sigma-70 factor (ECF subfamily)